MGSFVTVTLDRAGGLCLRSDSKPTRGICDFCQAGCGTAAPMFGCCVFSQQVGIKTEGQSESALYEITSQGLRLIGIAASANGRKTRIFHG